MSDSPERNMLKETIGKLKTKNITSMTNYFQMVKAFNTNLQKLVNSINDSSSKANQKEKGTFDAIILMLGTIVDDMNKVIANSLETIEELKLFSDTLESYSIQLDNSLSEIFAQAKKNAEVKTQEQEAIMKKPDAASENKSSTSSLSTLNSSLEKSETP